MLLSTFAAAEPLKIVVSINPMADWVRMIGGAEVKVDTLVGARVDPHAFELKPADLKLLSASNLIVLNGRGLEFWSRGFDAELMQKTLVLADSITSTNPDMHVWLNPQNVVVELQALTTRLCELRETACQTFRKNEETFSQAVRNFDNRAERIISGWSQKSFIAYHPAWSHFAARYGLIQEGSFKVGHSTDLRIDELKALIDLSRTKGIKVFFMEPGAAVSQVEGLVKEANLQIVVVDDLGKPGQSYLELMQENLSAMQRVMDEAK